MSLPIQRQKKLAFDFNAARITFARLIAGVLPVDPKTNQDIPVVYAEPETQDVPRPDHTYLTFKFTTPSAKNGDDTKEWIKDGEGNPTSVVNSGGVRRMTVDFDVYSTESHEDAYGLMGNLQTAFDLEDIQQILREAGIAVWIIGGIADLSQLLNTGYEGRAHMTCQFGIAMNLQSDLGEMDSVEVTAVIATGQGDEDTDTQLVTGE